MKYLAAHLKRLKDLQSRRGFTMIELLIVISILGILAIAVLSAINPVEQINRGRDTGTRSDAEQMLSAIDRFNAFQGFFPWQMDANDQELGTDEANDDFMLIDETAPTVTMAAPTYDGTVCPMLARLSIGVLSGGNPTDCVGSQELKESFTNRLTTSQSSRDLYIYNRGQQGDSTYICFIPQSGAFKTEAEQRCNTGLPTDLSQTAQDEICDVSRSVMPTGEGAAICLP